LRRRVEKWGTWVRIVHKLKTVPNSELALDEGAEGDGEEVEEEEGLDVG